MPQPTIFVIAEIGINHNGSEELATKLIDAAANAGANAVKFQKRTPRMSLPPDKWDQVRDTPWGERMTYIEYRERIELDGDCYRRLRNHAHAKGLQFGASPWDLNACNTLVEVGCDFLKVASAKLIDKDLIKQMAKTRIPAIFSTGMSTHDEVAKAITLYARNATKSPYGILACTSAYPAKVEDLNLSRIHTLRRNYPEARIGYSGHETGLWTTLCAAAMGAEIIERHITLDRSMPGSDQAASVEPPGFKLLVRELRNLEQAWGSGELRVLDCEQADMKRLRG